MFPATLARTTALTTLLVACVQASSQDTAAGVAEHVARLKSDDPKERTAATEALVRLGRRAIPLLETQKSDDPEVRSRIARAIARIRTTDPYLLLRSHERRISVQIHEESVADAHAKTFGGFPRPIPLHAMLRIDTALRVSLALDNAGYWETVERFLAASKTSLEIESSGLKIRNGAPSKTTAMQRQGRFLVSAQSAGGRIVLRLHAEPGLLPLRASLKLREVSLPTGESVLTRVIVEPSPEGPDQVQAWTPFPSATLAVIRVPRDGVPAGTVLSLEGSATVELAKDVDAVEFRRTGREEQGQVLSECTVTLRRLEFESDSFKVDLATAGPKGWKAPAGRPFLETLWLTVADDEGRSVIPGRTAYSAGGGGSMALQAGWEGPLPPKRFSVVRVTDIDSMDVPISLRGLAIPAD